jgi:hypothetical protein
MMRPLTITFGYIVRKYRKKKIKLEDLSLRKQMCLKYLQWATRKTKKHGYEFWELSKRWRKEECRYGGKRTRLERIARKFIQVKRRDEFVESRKAGGKVSGARQVKNRAGFLAPDKYEEHMRKLKAGAYPQPDRSIWWVAYPPEGEPLLVKGLASLCEEHNLAGHNLIATASRPWERSHHKGWRVEKYDPAWHQLTGIEMPDGYPTPKVG